MTLDVAAVLMGTGARVVRVASDGSRSEQELIASDLVRSFHGVSIDSRTIHQDDLFVALAGERADGHEFVSAALHGGARGAIVARVPEIETGSMSAPFYLFVAADALSALQSLAEYWRTRHSASIVGVTGSIGKTTTKDIVASVLATKWPVLWSEGNLNSEIGLPLTLLRLDERHRAGVFEMGMYAPGDIKLLAKIARPDIGVVTTVAPVHLERMKSVEAIAREKSRLIQALPSNGLAVLNADDPWTRAMAKTSGTAKLVLVGLASDADYRADELEPRGLEGMSFVIRAESQSFPVQSRVPGAHTVNALLSATAIARSMGMSWDEIMPALQQVKLESRQRLFHLRHDVLLIDDSYNAAPPSVLAALELLRSTNGTKVAVLGDMLELGDVEEDAHREIGARVGQMADWLVVRGERARWIAEQASHEGLAEERILTAETNLDAISKVRAIVGARVETAAPSHTMHRRDGLTETASNGCAILIKGSRGMRMEEIVQGLRDEAW